MNGRTTANLPAAVCTAGEGRAALFSVVTFCWSGQYPSMCVLLRSQSHELFIFAFCILETPNHLLLGPGLTSFL